jgi:hypothetical protein
MDDGDRSFTIVASSFDANQHEKDTRYINKSPYAAASKAANKLFDLHPKKGSVVRFKLLETTSGPSNGNTYEYEGKHVKINKKIERGGNTITITSEIKIKSVTDPRLKVQRKRPAKKEKK